jgi:hypothetical protein
MAELGEFQAEEIKAKAAPAPPIEEPILVPVPSEAPTEEAKNPKLSEEQLTAMIVEQLKGMIKA